jgi:hypothetical protein
MLAVVRLDLDHVRARHGHEERGVGPVVHVRKIEDRDARKRLRRFDSLVRLRFCCGHAASGIHKSVFLERASRAQLLTLLRSRKHALCAAVMRTVEHLPVDRCHAGGFIERSDYAFRHSMSAADGVNAALIARLDRGGLPLSPQSRCARLRGLLLSNRRIAEIRVDRVYRNHRGGRCREQTKRARELGMAAV